MNSVPTAAVPIRPMPQAMPIPIISNSTATGGEPSDASKATYGAL